MKKIVLIPFSNSCYGLNIRYCSIIPYKSMKWQFIDKKLCSMMTFSYRKMAARPFDIKNVLPP